MPVKFKDYYETLGVSRTATPEEIKAAFRKLARLYHPDVAKNKVSAEAKFKEINEANEVLSDPEKRRRYDELGADWQNAGQQAPPDGRRRTRHGPMDTEGSFEFGGTGFSDFFETFFGGGRNQGSGSSRGRTRGPGDDRAFETRGQDVEADILVTLEESLQGSLRKITLRRPGQEGVEEREDTYQVRIKPGMREGQKIRLAGQGYPGYGGGAAGDLFLHVRMARHPDFIVEGTDLHFELELAPWEVVLGVQVKIPTLDGTTSLRVPPGSTAGSRLRLRGLGLPKEDGGRGDLYATLRVVTPSVVSPQERELWEKLARISTFNPRTG